MTIKQSMEGYAFNKSKLNDCCKRYGINTYNKSVDDLLYELAKVAVYRCNFIGAGIARSAFDLGDCVLKLSKDYYIDIDDDGESENYYEGESEYETNEDSDTPWAYDHTDDLQDITYSCGQGMEEVLNYVDICADYKLKQYVAQIYAVSKGCAIELCEKADNNYCDTIYPAGNYELLEKMFSDMHESNCAMGNNGNLIAIDLGFYFDAAAAIKSLKLNNYNHKRRKHRIYFTNNILDKIVCDGDEYWKSKYKKYRLA